MKRVGIVTICDRVPNYGNRLQNYAVQQVLRSLGLVVVTYSFEEKTITLMDILKRVFHKLTFYRFTRDKFIWIYEYKRKKIFSKFTKRYIDTIYRKSISKNLKKEQDFFVVGSDQVWNPSWYNANPLKKEAFLLTFAKPEQKICFAPSFGVDKLPLEWEHWFQDNLSSFTSINVREQSGVDIVNKLTGKNSLVMIDPTMMLSQKQWLQLAKMPHEFDTDTPYILTYFIGGISDNAKKILESEQKKGLKHYSFLSRNDLDTYVLGPEEFIYLISKAKLVLTDSFHACVFSILFDIAFLAFPREGKETELMGRITTLLNCMNLKDRLISLNTSTENYYECDYSYAHRIIEKKREEAINYFKEAFSIGL